MASTDYTGRLVDFCIFPSEQTPNFLAAAEISSNSRVCAGPLKAIQNFIRILLTPLGQYVNEPSLGSNFYLNFKSSNLLYSSDLVHLFMIESAKVLQYMQSLIVAGTPLDEQINNVSLVNASVNRTVANLTIKFVMQSGDPVNFLLPVQWTI